VAWNLAVKDEFQLRYHFEQPKVLVFLKTFVTGSSFCCTFCNWGNFNPISQRALLYAFTTAGNCRALWARYERCGSFALLAAQNTLERNVELHRPTRFNLTPCVSVPTRSVAVSAAHALIRTARGIFTALVDHCRLGRQRLGDVIRERSEFS